MPVSIPFRRSPARALLPLLALGSVLSVSLGGCASVSDTISPAFVDPAKYELWECKQLGPERRTLANRLADQERLMAKAETGAGGAMVSEMVYRNDYITIRGQQKLLEEAWQKSRCRESDMQPAATPPAAPAPPAGAVRPSRPAPASKSGGAVY